MVLGTEKEPRDREHWAKKIWKQWTVLERKWIWGSGRPRSKFSLHNPRQVTVGDYFWQLHLASLLHGLLG